MKRREVVIVLLPEGVAGENVRSPDGSYHALVWFDADSEHAADVVASAFAKAGRTIALRVSEGVS